MKDPIRILFTAATTAVLVALARGNVTSATINTDGQSAVIDIIHNGPNTPLALPTSWGYIFFASGMNPLRVSENGVALLADGTSFYRWRAGTLERIHDYLPYPSTWVNPANGRTYSGGPASWFVNARGDIAICWQFSSMWLQDGTYHYGYVTWVKTWAQNRTDAREISIPTFTFVTTDFRGNQTTHHWSYADLKGIDDAGSVWQIAGLELVTLDPNQQRVRTGVVRVDASDATFPTPFQRADVGSSSFDFRGVNGAGIGIGSTWVGTVPRYFVGNAQVDFNPQYINKNSLVLSLNINRPGLMIRGPDGIADPAPTDGVATWIDDQNRANGYYNPPASNQRNAVWIRKKDVNGQLTNPAQYQRLDYVSMQPPLGWSTNHQVAPGTTSLQLGLMTRTDGSAELRPFLAFPAALAVDANRDGQVQLSDESTSDATTETRPFRFWLNDDDDERVMRTWTTGSTYTENEQDDKEVTSDANKDCNNLVIDTERDLEDLARLWIYTAGITDALKNGALRLGLKWTDVSSGTCPAIRLFKAAEADGGNAYLFTPATASAQVDQTAATGAHGMAVGNLIEGTNPVPLPTALFANLSESQPKTYLLFEGARAGKGQLKFVILDQNDQPIGEGPGVWIELKEPHEFVERYTCGDQSLGTVGALTHYTPSATFGAPTTEDEKDYVLYVHGYNMEDPEKQRWIETAFKRLYLLGYKGRVGGFSWPCAFGLVDQIRFDESEERAWQAGARLQEHLQNLKNAGYRVHVIAHSQGNVVTGEALRLWRAAGNATALVNTYIASQAAVAAHSYKAAAPLMPDYEQTTPNVYAVYWRAGDSARFPQTWPATNPPYFADSIMQTTAGRWVNFYNPQDYALTAANGGIGSWESDQRLKPDNFYNWSVTNGFFKGLVPFETSYSFPDDRYTIFSFCAEARSVAVGANATGGVFGSNTRNLQDFGYAAEHLWHSGQFRSFNAARYRYWQALMSACDLTPYNPN